MDKTTPPKTSIESLIRKAWKNRRDYDFVKITRQGRVLAGWEDIESVTELGNVTDYSTRRTESMNIQLCKGDTIIFTFAWDN